MVRRSRGINPLAARLPVQTPRQSPACRAGSWSRRPGRRPRAPPSMPANGILPPVAGRPGRPRGPGRRRRRPTRYRRGRGTPSPGAFVSYDATSSVPSDRARRCCGGPCRADPRRRHCATQRPTADLAVLVDQAARTKDPGWSRRRHRSPVRLPIKDRERTIPTGAGQPPCPRFLLTLCVASWPNDSASDDHSGF